MIIMYDRLQLPVLCENIRSKEYVKLKGWSSKLWPSNNKQQLRTREKEPSNVGQAATGVSLSPIAKPKRLKHINLELLLIN